MLAESGNYYIIDMQYNVFIMLKKGGTWQRYYKPSGKDVKLTISPNADTWSLTESGSFLFTGDAADANIFYDNEWTVYEMQNDMNNTMKNLYPASKEVQAIRVYMDDVAEAFYQEIVYDKDREAIFYMGDLNLPAEPKPAPAPKPEPKPEPKPAVAEKSYLWLYLLIGAGAVGIIYANQKKKGARK